MSHKPDSIATGLNLKNPTQSMSNKTSTTLDNHNLNSEPTFNKPSTLQSASNILKPEGLDTHITTKTNFDDPIINDVLQPTSTANDTSKPDEDNASIMNESTHSAATRLNEQVIAKLKTIYDPEIPVDIYALGLIYNIIISEENNVHIEMTLTTPGCPVAQTFPETVRQTVMQVEQVNSAEVELVWEPPWTPERMSEAARLELGFFP